MKIRAISSISTISLAASAVMLALPAAAGTVSDYQNCTNAGPQKVVLYGRQSTAGSRLTMTMNGNTVFSRVGQYKHTEITNYRSGTWLVTSPTLLIRESGATCAITIN